MNPPRDALTAVSSGAALVDRSDRVRLDVAGPDRAQFLHNLTTNDVKRLAPGRAAEAFVTSPQGKTLGFVTLVACDDRILVLTDPGAAGPILPHLQKYGVFDDVTVRDAGPETFEFHLAGPRADDLLHAAGAELPEAGDFRHVATRAGDRSVHVLRESPLGAPGLTVIGARADAESVRAALTAGGGASVLDPATADALRIEAGTPAAGRDVTPDNLPQEVGRDARAINFVKGCYLGQETVARIDALGHVNRHLRGLLLEGGPGDEPPAGSAIETQGKPVGVVTSSAYSPRRGRPVALGYVRTAHATPGSPVQVVVNGTRRAAVVTDLPIPPGVGA